MLKMTPTGQGHQQRSRTKFMYLLTCVQGLFILLFSLLVRYDDVLAKANFEPEQSSSRQSGLDIMEGQYPMAMDIQMMLFLGFGFLMTYLRRYGYSALAMVMTIVVVAVEWGVLCIGLTRITNADRKIRISWNLVLEASIASAAPLISFGAVLGKASPLQLLVMALLEMPLFAANSFIGYTVLQAFDVGGAIFIHTFGAYFGLAVSLVWKRKDYSSHVRAGELQNSRYTSDLFAFVGTLILWVYWPSFNAILAFGDGRYRAVMHTYLSLCASTITTLICSALFNPSRKLSPTDLQNASLSGGVVVGAVADLLVQPWGAVLAGSVAGVVATFGYQVLQDFLLARLNLHDSCGVNNLHGMPGIVGAALSALMAFLASEETYGKRLYQIFPMMVPTNGTEALEALHAIPGFAAIEPGLGRSQADQAFYQLAALLITLVVSIVGGGFTGLILDMGWLFDPVRESQFFDDELFFDMPADDVANPDIKDPVRKPSSEFLELRVPSPGSKSVPHGAIPALGGNSHANSWTAPSGGYIPSRCESGLRSPSVTSLIPTRSLSPRTRGVTQILVTSPTPQGKPRRKKSLWNTTESGGYRRTSSASNTTIEEDNYAVDLSDEENMQ